MKTLQAASIDEIRAELASRGKVAIIWDVEDVQTVRDDLDDDQALEVLQEVEREHDASRGVNWDLIEDTAGHLFPDDGDEPASEAA